VYIPSLQTVVAGDLLFSGIHPWLGTSTGRTRAAWLRALDRIAALRARTVIPGHLADPALQDDPAALAFTRDYLNLFTAVADTATSSEVLATAMRTRYPALAMANFPAFAARIAVPNQ
jgi:glyoxylase-like metal-dependent hydrolase (beta-lactamase superfamily II)